MFALYMYIPGDEVMWNEGLRLIRRLKRVIVQYSKPPYTRMLRAQRIGRQKRPTTGSFSGVSLSAKV